MYSIPETIISQAISDISLQEDDGDCSGEDASGKDGGIVDD